MLTSLFRLGLVLQLFNSLGWSDSRADLGLGLRDVPDANVTLVPGNRKAVCAAIDAVLHGGKVVYPASLEYAASLSNYYAQQASALHPNCFVKPTSSEDVSKTVKVLAQAYKLDSSNQFAFKSGGHTSWPGAANIANGVTIDLGELKQTTLSDDKKTALIRPGATWGDVYSALDGTGVGVTGGRVAQVGVGGLITGGGISFFSPKTGFACDSVKDFEIVLADGTITHANAQQNQDLWLALKGGSSNFGIVTGVTAYTFPSDKLWGGSATYSADTAPQQLQALAKFAGPDYDESASVIQSHTFTTLAGLPLSIVVDSLVYTVNQPYPASLKPFTDIPSISNTLRTDSLVSLSKELGASTPDGMRQFEMSMTYENDLALHNKSYSLFDATKAKVSGVSNLIWLLIFEPIPVAITSKALAKGGNVLGLASNTKPLMLVLVQAIWTNPADDDTVINTMKGLYKDIGQAARAAGKCNRWEYLNYADKSQDPISTYGPVNKAFLQSVAKKYDPKGVFQKASPGGFKLF